MKIKALINRILTSGLSEETQRIAADLRHSQAKLEAILDNIVDGLITIDEKGIVQSYNKACEKIFGYTADETVGQNVKMLMPEARAVQHDQYLANYMSTGVAKIIGIGRELEGRRKDGTIFLMDLSVAEVKLGGNKRLFSGIVRDITERKTSEARLEAILDNIVDGLITIDEKGTVQTYNKACHKIFGYKAEDVIGRNVNMLMPEPYHTEHDGYLASYHSTAVKKIIGIGRQVKGRRIDGAVFPMDLSVAEIKLGNKKFFSGIVRDVTERKDAEDALMRTNQELEKFAYVASHDLKAPLRNIDNLAQWVIEDTAEILPAESREKLDLLRGRVAGLETLLDDILSYSRAGRIVDEPVSIDSLELVQQIVQTHVPDSFKVKTKGSFPTLVSPRTPLEQIFGNLLSNAVKHHDKGKGNIEIEGHESGPFVEFTVRDDGPGIPPEFHERVFQMFQTLKSRDEVAGSGLGMAIIKKLVEWQGGRVWIESIQGKRGTTIHFLWPRNAGLKAA